MLKKNFLYSFFTQFPISFLNIVSGIILTRLLGVEGKGVYATIQANIQLFSLLLGFGLTTGIIYFTSSNKIQLNKLMGIAISILLLSSSLLGILIILPSPYNFFSYLFPKGYHAPFYYIYFILFFGISYFNSIISAVFQGKQNFKVINSVLLVNSSLSVLLFSMILIYDYFIPEIITLKHLLSISLITVSINAIIWIFLYIKSIKIIPSFKLSIVHEIKPIYLFIGITYIANLLNFLNYRIDIWFLNYYHTAVEVGYYSLATNIVENFWILTTPIITVLLPYLSNKDKNMTNVIAYISRVNISVLLCLAIFTFFTIEYILPFVYGKQFLPSISPLILLLPGIILGGSTKLFATYFVSNNQVHYNLKATIIGLVLTIILDFILIPQYGTAGAAIATSIAYTSVFLFVTIIYFTQNKTNPIAYFIIQSRDITKLFSLFSNRS